MYFNLNKECLLGLILLVQICSSDTDDKRWVWSDGRRSRSDDRHYTGLVNNDRKYTGNLGATAKPLFQPASNFGNDFQSSNEKQRYEVNEGQFQRPQGSRPPISPPQQYRPERPINGINGINNIRPDFNRPNELGGQTFNNRPGGFVDNYRPNRPIENDYRPGGNGFRPGGNGFRPAEGEYRPGGGGYRPVDGPNGRPILTGPVPSWEQNNPNRYRDYDKCKCVHSFNCNSPGIKFGTCDIDKQYCCYKGHNHPGGFGPGGIRGPIDRDTINNYDRDRPRPILAGPGGPVDGPGRPFQNKFGNNRPFRPFSDIDRYGDLDRERDFEEAYKKGLASALYEVYNRPNNHYDKSDYQGYRDYYRDDRYYYRYENIYKPYNRQQGKYGLYDPYSSNDYYYGRSSNSTILSTKTD